MTEILNIFFLLTSFLVIFNLPINNNLLTKKIYKNDFGVFEIYVLNIIVILNFLLFLSFFELNLFYVFSCFFCLALINLFFLNWSKNKKELLLISFFIIFLVSYSFQIASYPQLEWDAAVNWVFKTLNFKNGHNVSNLINVPGWVEYPHLGTYLWAIFWSASFFDNEYTGRLIFIFFYLISFFALIDLFKIKSKESIILLILSIIICYDSILISGYQEPLMFSLCIFFLILFNKINFNYKSFLPYFFLILCGNLILWTKNEGVLFLIFLNIFLLFEKRIPMKNRILVILAFIFLIIIKKYLFLFFFQDISLPNYEMVELKKIFSIEIFQRLPYLIFQISITMIKYPIYLIFIILMIYNFLNNLNSKENLIYLLFFLANILMSIGIFLLANDDNWKMFSQNTLDRLLYQTSGVYLIFIFNFFKYNFNKKLI